MAFSEYMNFKNHIHMFFLTFEKNAFHNSGYMICRYLIERLEWTPDKAIRTFNEARGYPITREQNLRSL